MNIPPVARWFIQGVVIFALLVTMVWLTIVTVNFTSKIRAESLLKDIQTLRAEQSTTADVQRIMSLHGGGPSRSSYASFCTPMDGAYDVWTGNQAVYWFERSVPILGRLGLRPWGTSATVVLCEGRVCYLHYSVGMEDPNGHWNWVIETRLLPKEQINGFGEEHPSVKVSTRDYKGARRLQSELASDATDEERRLAFAYDFSCVTRLRGCRQRCEIAPLLWQAEYQQSLNTGWTMPLEETTDPHCKFAKQSH
jgi:hypothetical protein